MKTPTPKSNARLAYEQWKMWLDNYPQDWSGAVAAASDFIDSASDLEAFGRIITTGGEEEQEQEPLSAIIARAELRDIEEARRQLRAGL